MRVLAARFPDPERASAALDSLHRWLDADLKAEIAPLASPEGPTETLLAGHFSEEQKDQVAGIVEQAGGEIVADVDERWTRPRFRLGSNAEIAYGEVEPAHGVVAREGVSVGGGFGAGAGGFGEASGAVEQSSGGFSDEGGRGFSF